MRQALEPLLSSGCRDWWQGAETHSVEQMPIELSWTKPNGKVASVRPSVACDSQADQARNWGLDQQGSTAVCSVQRAGTACHLLRQSAIIAGNVQL